MFFDFHSPACQLARPGRGDPATNLRKPFKQSLSPVRLSTSALASCVLLKESLPFPSEGRGRRRGPFCVIPLSPVIRRPGWMKSPHPPLLAVSSVKTMPNRLTEMKISCKSAIETADIILYRQLSMKRAKNSFEKFENNSASHRHERSPLMSLLFLVGVVHSLRFWLRCYCRRFQSKS